MSAPPPAPGANQTVEPYSIPISGSDDGSDDASSDDDATPNQGETKSTNRSSSTSRSAANPFTATTTSTGSAAAIDRDTSSMQEREVFSFGQNSYGELGHGLPNKKSSAASAKSQTFNEAGIRRGAPWKDSAWRGDG